MSRLLFVSIFVFLASTGCTSGPEVREEPLPFHVALVPVTVDVRTILDADVTSADPEAASSKSESLTLTLADSEVTDAIARALQERCFTRVSVLEYPLEMDAAEFYQQDVRERDQHWEKVAEGQDADLLIEIQVSYAPEVGAHINNQFWLNLPLFGLGGPFCYFVPDRSYDSSVVLDAFVYDLNPVLLDLAELGSAGAKLFYSEVRSETVSLNFMERAGGRFGTYAASLIIPAGLLAAENETVQKLVHREVIDTLIDNLVARIQEKRVEVIEAPALVNFQLQTDQLRFERGESSVAVSGEIVLRTGGGVDGIGALEMTAGDGPTVNAKLGTATFDPLRSGRRSRFLVYPFTATVPASVTAESLKVRVTDSSLNENARSFTFPLPAARAAAATVAPLASREPAERE